MSPWTVNNPPSPAKHWSDAEKRRCVAAANSALKNGKTEQEAIYACIGASGKGYKQVDEDGYDSIVEDGLKTFQDLIALYFAGRITLSVLRQRFQEALRLYFTRLMLLGLGDREPTEQDLEFLNKKIEEHNRLLEGFLATLAVGGISEARALWRAGLYATDREAYIYYTVPTTVALLMPGMPGEICLGNGLCGCHLDVQFDGEGNVSVYWIVDPQKESCEVCLSMAANSPFVFTQEEILSVV